MLTLSAGRPAIEVLFGAYEAALAFWAGSWRWEARSSTPSIIAAPKQRQPADAEKRDIKAKGGASPGRVGGQAGQARAEGPGRPLDGEVVEKVKTGSTRRVRPRIDLAVPAFGYKNHVGTLIPLRHGS